LKYGMHRIDVHRKHLPANMSEQSNYKLLLSPLFLASIQLVVSPPSWKRSHRFSHFKSLQVERFTYHGTVQKHAMDIDNLWTFYSNTKFQRMVFIHCCSLCMYIHQSLRKYTVFFPLLLLLSCQWQPSFSLSYTYPIREINVSVSLLTHQRVLSGSST
jgi:hypothetical protein